MWKVLLVLFHLWLFFYLCFMIKFMVSKHNAKKISIGPNQPPTREVKNSTTTSNKSFKEPYDFIASQLLDLLGVLRGGGESVLDNFNLNLLQLVIAYKPSEEQQTRLSPVHSKFTWKPKVGENHIMFSYIIQILHSFYQHWLDGSSTSLDFLAPTRKRLQPLGFTNSSWMGSPNPWFTGSNLKEASPTPWIYQKQL